VSVVGSGSLGRLVVIPLCTHYVNGIYTGSIGLY